MSPFQDGRPDVASSKMVGGYRSYKMADRMRRNPSCPTGYDVIQDGRPDVTSEGQIPPMLFTLLADIQCHCIINSK